MVAHFKNDTFLLLFKKLQSDIAGNNLPFCSRRCIRHSTHNEDWVLELCSLLNAHYMVEFGRRGHYGKRCYNSVNLVLDAVDQIDLRNTQPRVKCVNSGPTRTSAADHKSRVASATGQDVAVILEEGLTNADAVRVGADVALLASLGVFFDEHGVDGSDGVALLRDLVAFFHPAEFLRHADGGADAIVRSDLRPKVGLVGGFDKFVRPRNLQVMKDG